MDYIKLGTRYYRDPAIVEANARTDGRAEILFLRGLATSGQEESEGVLTRASLGFMGLSRPERTAAVLVDVGLWLNHPQGWLIRSWEKWQSEHDKLARRRRSDRDRKAAERARNAAAGPHPEPSPSRDNPADSRQTSRDMRPPESRDVTRTSARVNREEIEKERTTEEAKASSSSAVERADIERVCAHLADRVAANGSRRPAITQRWRDSARLLIDRDGRSEDNVHTAIDWCQDDEFWRANILSLPKLREKYDQLRLAARRTGKPTTAPTVTHIDTWAATKELDRQLAEREAEWQTELADMIKDV